MLRNFVVFIVFQLLRIMATKIFINLPVQNLSASVDFFTQLGFRHNPQYSNDNGVALIISEEVWMMLLERPLFQSFTPKPVVDAHQANEAIFCLAANSRADVDRMVEAALAAGGQALPQEPHEFMYDRAFQDLDGHLWNILYMEPAAASTPE